MSKSDRDQLIDMGFNTVRIDKAIKATGNKGLQPIMDWLLEHQDDSDIDIDIPEIESKSASTFIPSSSSNQQSLFDDDEPTDADAAALLAEVARKKKFATQNPIPIPENSLNQNPSQSMSVNAISPDLNIESTDEPPADQTANSLKCSECGKIFKGTAQVQWHAAKTGHESFEESMEEIKPLTESEKKMKLEELRIRLAEKRAYEMELEKQERKKNELSRRKGAQDIGLIRQQIEQKEMNKEAEARRREKREAILAEKRVLKQIEADKQARKEKAEREKLIKEGNSELPILPCITRNPMTMSSSLNSKSCNFSSEARLSIRPKDGSKPIIKTFKSETRLKEVIEYIQETLELKSTGNYIGPIKLGTTFPRKLFTDLDLEKTLKELNLCPSAALVIQ